MFIHTWLLYELCKKVPVGHLLKLIKFASKPEQLGLSSSIRLEQQLRYKSWLNRLSDSPARLPCVLTKKLKEKRFSRIIPKQQKLQWWHFTIKCNTTLGNFCEIFSSIGPTVYPKDPRVQNPLLGSGNLEILISTKGSRAKI